MQVKFVSVKEPWASLLTSFVKSAELRSWFPSELLISEWLYIHASKGVDKGAEDVIRSCVPARFFDVMVKPRLKLIKPGFVLGKMLFTGALPSECAENHVVKALCPPCEDYYLWEFGAACRLVEPFEMKGQLGIYTRDIDDGLLRTVSD